MRNVEQDLKKLQRKSEPSTKFKQELWSALSVQFDHEYPQPRFAWGRILAMPLAVLVVFLMTGTGVYAYSSSEVVETSPLYSIKRGLERVEEQFYRKPAAAAEFHARMMERRLAEGEFLMQKGDCEQHHLEPVVNQMNLSVQHLQKMQDCTECRNYMVEKLDMYNMRYSDLAQRFIDQYPTAEEFQQQVRNKMHQARVYIDESGLTEEEKAILLQRLEESLVVPRYQLPTGSEIVPELISY